MGQTRKLRNSRARSRKVCPPGQTYRKGFERKFSTDIREKGYTVKRGNISYRAFPTSDKMYVHSACVKDPKAVGLKRRGTLQKGELRKHGYSYRKGSPLRHAALQRALKDTDPLVLYKKLDAAAKIAQRKAPDAAKIFKKDRDWVRGLGAKHH